MQKHFDHNPANPFTPPIQPETHTVNADGTIRLYYIPKKDSISIAGFTEKFDSNVGINEFYVDYQDTNSYRTAQGYIYFNRSQATNTVAVNYQGVSTVIWADYLNEVKGHVDNQDIHLSNITVDPTTITAYGLTGSVTQFFSWIVKKFVEVTGVAWDAIVPASLKKLWELKWNNVFIIPTPADLYTSPGIPLSRDGNMATMDFHVTGSPTSATVITVKKNGVALSPTVSLSASGKTTLTFTTAVVGVADDLFSYSVAGSGLSACIVVANVKWVNR